MTTEFGLWDQIRVDCGREWYLMLFVQEQLSHLRNDTSKLPHLRSSSKNVGSKTLFLKHVTGFHSLQNRTVERIWVKVNACVNYTIKEALIKMMDSGDICMDE